MNISNALVMIRKRFPINKFPSVTLMQVNGPLLSSIPLPDTLQVSSYTVLTFEGLIKKKYRYTILASRCLRLCVISQLICNDLKNFVSTLQIGSHCRFLR